LHKNLFLRKPRRKSNWDRYEIPIKRIRLSGYLRFFRFFVFPFKIDFSYLEDQQIPFSILSFFLMKENPIDFNRQPFIIGNLIIQNKIHMGDRMF
jgi:hypothetical protein